MRAIDRERTNVEKRKMNGRVVQVMEVGSGDEPVAVPPGWYVWRFRNYFEGPWTEWFISEVRTIVTPSRTYTESPPWASPYVYANGLEVRGPFLPEEVVRWMETDRASDRSEVEDPCTDLTVEEKNAVQKYILSEYESWVDHSTIDNVITAIRGVRGDER